MTYSGEEALVTMWLPAIRTLRPASQLALNKAAAHALTPDGYVDPDALLPGSTARMEFDAASTTASSSDIANYTTYISTVTHLPSGLWVYKARGALCGRLSGSSNMNTIVRLNGQDSANFQIPLAAGDMGVAFPRLQLDAVSGDVTLEVMFRPSAGTLTIESGEWLYYAERIG